MSLNISTKLWLGFGVVLLVLAISGGLSMVQLGYIRGSLAEITDVEEPTSNAAYEMEINLIGTGFGVLGYLEDHDPEHLNRIEKDKNDFADFQAQYYDLSETEKGRTLGDTINKEFAKYTGIADDLIKLEDEQTQKMNSLLNNLSEMDEILDKKLQASIDQNDPLVLEKTQYSMEMEVNINGIDGGLGNYLRIHDPAHEARVLDDEKDFQLFLSAYKGLALSTEEIQWAEQVERLFISSIEAAKSVIALEKEKVAMLTSLVKIRRGIDVLLDDEIQVVTAGDLLEAKIDAESTIATSRTWTIYLLVFAIVLGGAAATFITRSITQPLKTTVALAEEVALGNLDIAISTTDRRDEIGILAKAFSRMVAALQQMAAAAVKVSEGDLGVVIEPQSKSDRLGNAFLKMTTNMRAVISEIQDAGNVLTSAVNQMMSSATQIASSVNETVTTVSEATISVEETRQTAEVANQKAQSVSEAGQKAEQAARGGNKSIADTLKGMNRIREQMESVAETIVRLSEQSLTVGEIITTVNALADQSNLLAVNAAIEAAKAGEAGKGFAVVAQEVRNLADQSRQATVEVRQILSEIQKGVSTAVMATEQGTKAVEAGVQQATEAATAIQALSDTITESAQAGVQIGVSSQQQITGVEQTVMAMESIKEASTQNAASARQLQKGAEDLQEMGKKLSQLVARFKV